MDTLVVIVGSALVVGAIIVLVWALTSERELDMAQGNLGRGGMLTDSRQIALSASAKTRILEPLFESVARRAKGFTTSGMGDRVQRKLDLAGLYEKGWTVERMLVIRVASIIAGVILILLVLSVGTGRQSLGLALLIGVIAFLGPEAILDRKAGERQGQIEKSLPDVIDQLTVSVEAGLGFDAAMARSAEGRSGPLADELARVLQDLQVGVDRQTALDRLVERTDVPDLRGFVTAIRQSTRHGLPIANVLKVQSQELREKRRARVEEKAAQLPVKIVFPLVFCILPSLFVIILGPAGINIMDSF
ncbi:MAG TPA: type II secretion system F family protein [Acidimicrobiales bacterium]|nr:type II secretion system F family protein [Acidimicrobiales bacterium]